LKYLLILGIIALIFYALLFWRMRRYFPVVRQIFSITRQLYRLTKGSQQAERPITTTKRGDGERLVRCASCGTWIPADRAVTLRAKASAYCSTSCLENAAAQPRDARRSAKG
jgi:nicotinamide riboside transporter PnuC